MSKIDELIEKLCPNGVPYMKIKEIGQVKMCKRIMKSDTNNVGGVPFYKIGTFGKKADSFISEEKFNEYRKQYSYPKKGDILISCSGTIGRIVVFDGEPAYFQDSNIVWLEHDGTKVTNEYLKYVYATQPWKISTGGTIARLYNDNILDTKIAVPPLEVQDEIVHVLDDFMLLSAELSAELKARQKQYEYYRDELLTFKNEKYEYMTLGEIATDMYRGNGIKRTDVTETGIPCVRYGEIYTSYNVTFKECISHTDESIISSKKYFEHGDVLFAITGESVDEIGKSIVYLGNNKCLAGGDMVVMKHNQNPKYMAYVLSTTQAQMQKSKGKVKSKVVHSSVPDLKEISIPIPPLEVQEKVANMLERFDKLCNDITEGLPAEIEARQKQYEYYRDKLLTFKELGNE